MATPTEPILPSQTLPLSPVVGTVIPTAERSIIASPIGWSAILAGTAVAIGVWLILHLFGVGVGLIAIQPDDANSLRRAGIGVGVWSLIAPIVAVFIGGLVAGRVAPTINTLNAAIHGAVVWALVGLITLSMLTMTIGAVVRGAAATGTALSRGAVSSMTAVGRNATGDGSLSSLGIDANDLIAPINQRLAAQGMPPVKPEDLEAVVREALRTAVRQGGTIDRETLIQITTKHTQLSGKDAERIADQLEDRLSGLQTQGREFAKRTAQVAEDAAETAGKTLVWMAITMLVGLGAAVAGAILSVRRERREHVVMPRREPLATT